MPSAAAVVTAPLLRIVVAMPTPAHDRRKALVNRG